MSNWLFIVFCFFFGWAVDQKGWFWRVFNVSCDALIIGVLVFTGIKTIYTQQITSTPTFVGLVMLFYALAFGMHNIPKDLQK